MSVCHARDRAAVRTARDRLEQDIAVAAAAVVAPATSPTGRWALEILCPRSHGGLPPVVLSELADVGLTVRRVHRGGDCWRALAVVRG